RAAASGRQVGGGTAEPIAVGLTGIEPALPKELDPKSSASASSATAPPMPRRRHGAHARLHLGFPRATSAMLLGCTTILTGRQCGYSALVTVGTTHTFRSASTSLCNWTFTVYKPNSFSGPASRI